MAINKFQGETRWLSNFQECDVLYEGVLYPTTEHAFQAAKSLNQATRKYVAALSTPREAKSYGNNLIKLRPDWEEVKRDIMFQINFIKYSDNEWLRDMLIQTGEEELIEGNTWGDTYWGVSGGVGCNELGKILMEIRTYFKDFKKRHFDKE